MEFRKKKLFSISQKKIKELNGNSNIEIVLTRDSDTYPTLTDRTIFINNLEPDLVISLHINGSTNTEKNGAEIYVEETHHATSKKISREISRLQSNGERTLSFKKHKFPNNADGNWIFDQ